MNVLSLVIAFVISVVRDVTNVQPAAEYSAIAGDFFVFDVSHFAIVICWKYTLEMYIIYLLMCDFAITKKK